ncbi:GNAT family N-acetyltransferase [Acinetobacter sp. Marseille-Q1618]|uniref:GNAT family N-acetyltransferase n=1 Tax=Acinetobacter sp. Marseille-Q1618 TaxID=2697502 RepID=UPI001570CCCC|nr:GNAT family N-acetyltransferase [Acinetobacter sp. Marseille-Q1618]
MLKIIPITTLSIQLEQSIFHSQQEKFRFLTRLKSEFESGVNRFDQQGEALFAVYKNKQLIGIAGLNQQPYDVKNSLSINGFNFYPAEIGRIRRFYIHPNFRQCGIARKLLTEIKDFAQHYFKILTLFTDTTDAAAFYQACAYHACQHPKISHFKILSTA